MGSDAGAGDVIAARVFEAVEGGVRVVHFRRAALSAQGNHARHIEELLRGGGFAAAD